MGIFDRPKQFRICLSRRFLKESLFQDDLAIILVSPVRRSVSLNRGNCFQDLPFTVAIPDCFLLSNNAHRGD
jgi:hypothetical protein